MTLGGSPPGEFPLIWGSAKQRRLIVVKAKTLSGVTLHADGGTGGNQELTNPDEAEGPGGGGGGGFIAIAGGTVTQTATGKLGGTTNSMALTSFPSNGATSGAAGQTGIAIASLPICATTTTIINPPPGPPLGVSGGGCNAGGGGLGLGAVFGVIALVLLRRRRAVVAAALVTAAVLPRLAAAQTAVMEPKSFGVERFQLASGRDSLFDVEWAEVRGNMAVTAALWTGLANDPLVIYEDAPGNRVGSLVANRMGGSLSASISPSRWLQLGFDLPLVVYQNRPGTSVLGMMESLNSFGTGNLRLLPKLVVLHQADHGVSLAFVPALIVPTHSTSDAYFDDGGFGFAPEVVLSRRWTGWRASIDAGYHARRRAQFLNQIVDDELFTHVGAGYQFADRGGPPVGVDLTLSGATAARAPLQNFNEDHLETLAGATYDVTGDAQLFAGAGVGLRMLGSGVVLTQLTNVPTPNGTFTFRPQVVYIGTKTAADPTFATDPFRITSTINHELGHAFFNLPDRYLGFCGSGLTGQYDIMADNCAYLHFTIYDKMKFGWIQPPILRTHLDQCVGFPAAEGAPAALVLVPPAASPTPSGQYWIVENRNKAGT